MTIANTARKLAKLKKNLHQLQWVARETKRAKSRVAAVGLPISKAGSKIYESKRSVIEVGFWHEFGTDKMPMRSWMRVPFKQESEKLFAVIAAQWGLVFAAKKNTDAALDRIGLVASNISKGAFRKKGYGEWPDITEETKRRKGSTAILIDTGLLRSSITWVVRDAA